VDVAAVRWHCPKAGPHGRPRIACTCGNWVPVRTAISLEARRQSLKRSSRPQDNDRGLWKARLTFQAITIWRDELLSKNILLRDGEIGRLSDISQPQMGDEKKKRLGRARRRDRNKPPKPPAEVDADGKSDLNDDDDEG